VNPVQRLSIILLGLLFLAPAAARSADGFRIYESTVASVNGEVLFLSDVEREACFYRCAAMPGSEEETLSAGETRDRLVLDALALHEQGKLLLGTVDNAVLEGHAREAESRMAACTSSCKDGIPPGETREWIRRKLLIRDFFNRRVAVFVEVKDDDVAKELRERSSSPGNATEWTSEQIRDEMFDARVAQEIRNWQTRAASKSRVILSPMGEQ